MLTVMTFTVGCSSNQVDEIKVDIAEEIQSASEGALKKVYSDHISDEQYSALSCALEARLISLSVEDFIRDKIDAPPRQTGVQKIVGEICGALVDHALPLALAQVDDRGKPCLKLVADRGVSQLGSSICARVAEE